MQIAFVPHQHDNQIVTRTLLQPPQPIRHMLEGLHIRDIIDQQCSDSAPEVRLRDSLVLLFAGSVPNLCAYLLVIVRFDNFCLEFHADGGFRVLIEIVTHVSQTYVGLAYAGIADQDNLILIVVLCHFNK